MFQLFSKLLGGVVWQERVGGSAGGGRTPYMWVEVMWRGTGSTFTAQFRNTRHPPAPRDPRVPVTQIDSRACLTAHPLALSLPASPYPPNPAPSPAPQLYGLFKTQLIHGLLHLLRLGTESWLTQMDTGTLLSSVPGPSGGEP